MMIERLIDNWYPKMDCIYEEKLLNLIENTFSYRKKGGEK